MAFATANDVAIRLGRALTAAEAAMVNLVIEEVTGLIAEVVDKDAAWAAALSPVPTTLRALCIEKALAIGSNPNGLRSSSESLGAYEQTKSFRDDSGLWLSPVEERQAVNAVFGTTSGTSYPDNIVDRLMDLAEGRDVDEDAV